MSRVTRAVVLASASTALLTISYLAYGRTTLFWMAMSSWILIFLAAGKYERTAVALVLATVYVTPAMSLMLIGRNVSNFVTLWMGGLLALIAGSSWRDHWSLPLVWRWPCVLVALTVALSWPAVGLRELDFTFANALNTRLPVAGGSVSAIASVGAVALTAANHLIGLLWFDWLWSREVAGGGCARRVAVTVLAAAILVSAGVGAYQGFVNLSFLSGHLWPLMLRATGTLMDANVFGALVALWSGVFLALAVQARTRVTAVGAIAALLLCWIGVWVSGSRTAALAAVVAVAIGASSLRRGSFDRGLARTAALAFGAAVLAFGLLTVMLESRSTSALARARYLVPALSIGSAQQTLAELWSRDGYGTTSVAIIREYPLFGLGVGCFNTLVHDFATEHGLNIPPDNAQNWIRHQLAELGFLGSIGWLLWLGVFLAALWRRTTERSGAAMAIRGPLVALALVSLLGMPTQEPAVLVTFWLLLAWYLADRRTTPDQFGEHRPWRYVVAIALAGAYSVAVAVTNDLRPPFRSARFGFPYTYGVDFESPTQAWTAQHGVTVQEAAADWMKLTVWVNHPDAEKNAVEVDVWKDHAHIINQNVFRGRPVTRAVYVGRGKRFVLEAKVDRTFRPSAAGHSSDNRDLGLAMKWEFVQEAPK